MPPIKLTLLSATAAFTTASANNFAPSFGTGPVSSGNFIRESTYTIVVPQAPTGSSDDLALWIGMGTSNGDLIQTIVDHTTQAGWTTFAYTLVDGKAVSDKRTSTSTGHQVVTRYKYNDATQKYDQTVLLDGTQVSQLSTSSGKAQGWGTAAECQSDKCGTSPPHQWVNATIIMDQADPSYIKTLTKGEGVIGDLKTSDGGKTWTVGEISIPSYTF